MTAKQSGLRGKVRDGTVAVQANVRHRLYKKTVRRVRRLMAHDEREEAALGDRVRIIEAAPISRRKRWRLLEVLTRVELPEVAPESIDLDLLGEVKPEETEVEEAAAPSDGAKAEPEEAAPAEAVPEAEAVVPEEIEVAEEVPEIETVEAAAEEPAAVEEEEAPDEPAESDEAPDEGEPS